MVRAAVVGAGSIAREYALRHLTEELGVSVVAVADQSLRAAQDLARDVALRRAGGKVVGGKYRETVQCSDKESESERDGAALPAVRACASLSSLLDKESEGEEVDLCYIATPPSSHAALVAEALSAGKHVLLEKPLAVTNEDAQAIVAAAESAFARCGAIVAVNIGMRYCEAAIRMKTLIDSGHLGEIERYSLKLLFRQWPRAWQTQPWVAQRAEGGPLLEVGTHYLFALLEILGDRDGVSAVCTQCTYPDGEQGVLCESAVTGYLQLRSGARVSIDIHTRNEEAIAAERDIYELSAEGTNGRSLVLVDFVRLCDGVSHEEIPVHNKDYGRKECVIDLVESIRARDRDFTGRLVTPAQAQRVQQLIDAMRTGAAIS